MRSNIFREARIGLLILASILTFSVVFYFFVSMFTSIGYESRRADRTGAEYDSARIIIIDAGHGGEDPGASVGNLLEKDLNLSISLKLNDFLTAFGFKTRLTRNTDRLLYNSGEESRKKFYDLKNRVEMTNEFNNPVFVSVHMNKFPATYCKGLQTFYSENDASSKLLAELIQENARVLQTTNKRLVKRGNETIFLLKNLKIPAVLVECGFLSNPDEAESLQKESYQKSLSFSLSCGIAEFLEN